MSPAATVPPYPTVTDAGSRPCSRIRPRPRRAARDPPRPSTSTTMPAVTACTGEPGRAGIRATPSPPGTDTGWVPGIGWKAPPTPMRPADPALPVTPPPSWSDTRECRTAERSGPPPTCGPRRGSHRSEFLSGRRASAYAW